MSNFRRGRPKKDIPYDPEANKEFIKRFFTLQNEILGLKEDQKHLKEEFKDKINQKLMNQVIKLVKIELQLKQLDASDQTIEELKEIVVDKINMVM